MKKIVHASTKYVINGREYNSLEEIPEPERQFFLDANQNGIPDGIEKLVGGAGVTTIQSQTYEVRHNEVMIDDETGRRLPASRELIDAAGSQDVGLRSKTRLRENPWIVTLNLKTLFWLLVLAGGLAIVIALFTGS